MPRRSDARERMVRSAARMFSLQGVQGTSLHDVLEHSGAPRGSIYHHFPDGKTELAQEAVRWAGEHIIAATAAALETDDPIAAIGILRRQWARVLRGSDFRAGCTIVAAALEGERQPLVADAAGEVFSSWEQVLADAFHHQGVTRPRSRSIATLIIASIEGAIILARARRTIAPLERVADELELIAREALESVGARSTRRAGKVAEPPRGV